MNKGKAAALGDTAGQVLHLVERMILGGVLGVALTWALTALWPPSRDYVERCGYYVQTLSRHYPVVMVGLLLGIAGALIWQAYKKG
jgi:membrane-associated phospholipid phosphatase